MFRVTVVTERGTLSWIVRSLENLESVKKLLDEHMKQGGMIVTKFVNNDDHTCVAFVGEIDYVVETIKKEG